MPTTLSKDNVKTYVKDAGKKGFNPAFWREIAAKAGGLGPLTAKLSKLQKLQVSNAGDCSKVRHGSFQDCVNEMRALEGLVNGLNCGADASLKQVRDAFLKHVKSARAAAEKLEAERAKKAKKMFDNIYSHIKPDEWPDLPAARDWRHEVGEKLEDKARKLNKLWEAIVAFEKIYSQSNGNVHPMEYDNVRFDKSYLSATVYKPLDIDKYKKTADKVNVANKTADWDFIRSYFDVSQHEDRCRTIAKEVEINVGHLVDWNFSMAGKKKAEAALIEKCKKKLIKYPPLKMHFGL